MKIFSLFFTLILSARICAAIIHDDAHLINQNDLHKIERWVDEIEAKTTAQVAVVTLKSLEGAPIENYAVRLFEKLGVGQREKDNGVLFLVSVQDRLLRIEVGYGLEEVITDILSNKIINTIIVPEFKNESYSKGILKGVWEVISLIAANSQVTPPIQEKAFEDPIKILSFILFLALVLLSMWIHLTKSSEEEYDDSFGSSTLGKPINYFNRNTFNSNSSGGGGRSGGGGASGKW